MFSQNLIFFIFSHLKDSCAASEAAHATNCKANSISTLVARFERVSMRAAQQLSLQALQTRSFRKISFLEFSRARKIPVLHRKLRMQPIAKPTQFPRSWHVLSG